jgi:MFS family permease
VAFGLVAAASAAVAVGMVTGRVEAPNRALARRSAGTNTEACESSDTSPASLLWAPLALFGGLGALAFAVENAFQSWSALFLRDAVDAGPALAAAGPAVFAGVAAATRFAASGLGARRPTAVLVVGSAVAAVGSITVAGSATVPVALLGSALAAAGTAVLFPTLISVLTERVPDALRGTATSRVTGLSYVGFLLGPVYFGWWAEWTTLAGAMLAVAGLAALLTVLVGALMRRDHQVSVGAAGVAP